MKWGSPWSEGYPGWHIEDTAIAMKYFGAQYDIHGGAIELVFPHHEAEVAQAEATSGIKPYVKYWIHTGLLTINKEKMSKSVGNIIRISEALKKYSPETVRLWIASTYYRKPLDYNETDLRVAKNKIDKIRATINRIRENKEKTLVAKALFSNQIATLSKNFFNAMKDDLNTPLALSNLFKTITLVNRQIDIGKFSMRDLIKAEKSIREQGEFFQIIPQLAEQKLPDEVAQLIKEREEARKEKNWTKGDLIREQIQKLGYTLEDTIEGAKWRKTEV
jgi:cysteinyl-tRNA synthetase